MVSTDPIADMLTRVRNALSVNQAQVVLPHSAVKERIATTLAANGFLKKVATTETNSRKNLILTIYGPDEKVPITAISRISRPGRRSYVKASQIPVIKRGRGIVIISTSKGVMTGQEALTQQLGGELICKVY